MAAFAATASYAAERHPSTRASSPSTRARARASCGTPPRSATSAAGSGSARGRRCGVATRATTTSCARMRAWSPGFRRGAWRARARPSGGPGRRARGRAGRALRRGAPRAPRDLRGRRAGARRPARRVPPGARDQRRLVPAAREARGLGPHRPLRGRRRLRRAAQRQARPRRLRPRAAGAGRRAGRRRHGRRQPRATTSTARWPPACAASGSTAPATRGRPIATTSSRSPTSTSCRRRWPRWRDPLPRPPLLGSSHCPFNPVP